MIVEKAAFAALEADDDGAYEELEDDFMLLANEGQIALEVVEEEVSTKKSNLKKNAPGQPFDLNEADFRSRDIQIITGNDAFEDEEEKALKDYREQMAALLPTEGANFSAVYENQNDLDAGFDAFMDEEYDEDKIGELYEEDVQAVDKINKKVLDEACDEFIEDKKRWFMDLAKEFGDERA